MGTPQSLQQVEGEEARKCPECGSKDITRRDTELFCNKCGLVID
ncbi:hypothetical protein HYU13_04690 [Candidatus Woesearchaeota archaeon]|nr:hypothetical protein [Candidatus Woesearchaeota archaeon]